MAVIFVLFVCLFTSQTTQLQRFLLLRSSNSCICLFIKTWTTRAERLVDLQLTAVLLYAFTNAHGVM